MRFGVEVWNRKNEVINFYLLMFNGSSHANFNYLPPFSYLLYILLERCYHDGSVNTAKE